MTLLWICELTSKDIKLGIVVFELGTRLEFDRELIVAVVERDFMLLVQTE